jgi:thiamine phosphate synthase YjbQ (UPF0047 family)
MAPKSANPLGKAFCSHLMGLLIQWSVKVECWMEDSILGMWQVVQFFVLTGQAAPG